MFLQTWVSTPILFSRYPRTNRDVTISSQRSHWLRTSHPKRSTMNYALCTRPSSLKTHHIQLLFFFSLRFIKNISLWYLPFFPRSPADDADGLVTFTACYSRARSPHSGTLPSLLPQPLHPSTPSGALVEYSLSHRHVSERNEILGDCNGV